MQLLVSLFLLCLLLRLGLDLYLHALQHEGADVARLPVELVRGDARPLENVVQEPRFAASQY
ncbi:MAG: hypothetical protein IJ089_04520 [Clostridia bacterium]|nr:hypothetical protein [Clostridia bacterium]